MSRVMLVFVVSIDRYVHSNVDLIENRRVVGVDRFRLGMKRLGRLAPFADGDRLPIARARVRRTRRALRRRLATRRSNSPATAAPPADNAPPARLRMRSG